MRLAMIVGLLVALGVLAPGAVHALEVGALVNQLGEVPGINIVPVNETAWLLVVKEPGQICLNCACNTQRTGETRENSCCEPNCAQQHRGSCKCNDCFWSIIEKRWYTNQCKFCQ